MSTMLDHPAFSGAATADLPGDGPAAAGILFWTLVQWVIEEARRLGYERREEIERAAEEGLQALIAWDIPGLPPIPELFFDRFLSRYGMPIIRSILDSVLGDT